MQLQKLKVIEYDQLTSTNSYLKENYLKYSNLTVIKANYQTNGYGQFDRNWVSNKNENLLMSFLLRDFNIEYMNMLKKIVIESLLIFLKTTGINGKFVEPNDIYVNNKKILGILIETKINSLKDKFKYVIIGLGININQTKFSIENATSIKSEIGTEYGISKAFSSIINIFVKNFNDKMKLL